ncbi:MAG: sigma-70 family RNA polymerase sigma factor [Nocardioidaceae bacterium]
MRPSTKAEELAALMARVATGDQLAFATLYDATARSVFGIVLRVLRNPAHAEEVTQEVFVEAWRSAPRFDPRQGSLSAWLNTIAHHKAVDRVRSEERSTQREQRHFDASAVEVHVADASDVAVTNDEGRRVRAALGGLPDGQRTALILAYFEGKSQREIAELLKVPLGTVKTRTRDAMKRLRRQLGEESA